MAGRKKFRPSKNEFDRAIEDFGLSAMGRKDLSLYPKLAVCPIPFPYQDPILNNKIEQLNIIAADLSAEFRTSSSYIRPKVIETPDVERFSDPTVLKESFGTIDYRCLPLELHPNFDEIQKRHGKKKRKFAPKPAAEMKEKKERILNNLEDGGDLNEKEILEVQARTEEATIESGDDSDASEVVGDYGVDHYESDGDIGDAAFGDDDD